MEIPEGAGPVNPAKSGDCVRWSPFSRGANAGANFGARDPRPVTLPRAHHPGRLPARDPLDELRETQPSGASFVRRTSCRMTPASSRSLSNGRRVKWPPHPQRFRRAELVHKGRSIPTFSNMSSDSEARVAGVATRSAFGGWQSMRVAHTPNDRFGAVENDRLSE